MLIEGNPNVLLVCFFLDLDENYDLHGCTERRYTNLSVAS